MDLLKRRVLIMLSRYDDGIYTNRLAVHVFNRNLRFSVGTEVFKRTVLANFRQTAGNAVGQSDWKRHKLRRFVRREAEHQALVACTNVFIFFLNVFAFTSFNGRINALRDICGLLVKGSQDGASAGVKTVLSACIANFLDRAASNSRNIDIIRTAADLADNENEPSSYGYFTSYTGIGIHFKESVENCVRNLVAYFIGMAFRYGFRSKQVSSFKGHADQPPRTI